MQYGIIFSFTKVNKGKDNILLFKTFQDCQTAYNVFVEVNKLINNKEITLSDYKNRVGIEFRKASDGLECICKAQINEDGEYRASHIKKFGYEMGEYLKSVIKEAKIINYKDEKLTIID